jgi:O-Antigen ligase
VSVRVAAPAIALGAAAAVVSYRRVTIVEWSGLGLLLLIRFVRRPADRRVTGALIGAAVVGVLAVLPHSLPGWTDRADIVSAGAPVDSGRGALLPQAAELFRSSPLTGVGPVQYYPKLVRRHPAAPTIVHVVPVLLTVEGGVGVGVALVGLAVTALLALRRRARRTPGAALLEPAMLASPIIAMSMLTPLPVMYAIGPLLSALNIATVGAALELRAATSAGRATPS